MFRTHQTQALLDDEADRCQAWLDKFETSNPPLVELTLNGETMVITNFPLPDAYRPDRVSMAIVLQHFPAEPPKGLYLMAERGNQALLQLLRRRFNVFNGTAFHGAPAIAGFEWICVGYLNGWRFDVRAPHRGDNVCKMLQEFWRLLEEE